MVPAGDPHSPKRSSTVHTSARRPPGAGEARSGALQERPARKSRACTYSRPSALAWATSSLSVGERSKASMISAAKTEERRSTSMARAQARGATPTNRLSSAQIASSQVAKGLLPRKKTRRRGARHSGLHRVRPGRVPDRFKPPRRSAGSRPQKGPVSDNLSFCTPSLLKHSVTFILGSKLNLAGPCGGQGLETPRGSGDRFFDHNAWAPGPVWGRRKMQGSLLQPADKQDPASSSLPASRVLKKAPNCSAVPGLGGNAPAHLAEPVFVPGVAVPMALHPGDRRHTRPTHLSRLMARRATVEFWFQDPLAAVSACLDPSIQTRERAPRPSARPVHARAEAQAPPVFPRARRSPGPEGCGRRTAGSPRARSQA